MGKGGGPRNRHFKLKIDKKGQKMASRVKFDIKFEFFGQFYHLSQIFKAIRRREKIDFQSDRTTGKKSIFSRLKLTY